MSTSQTPGETVQARVFDLIDGCGKANWDSYGAAPITEDAGVALLRWIGSGVFPRAGGGFLLEWDLPGGGSLLIDVTPDGEPESIYAERADGAGWSWPAEDR